MKVMKINWRLWARAHEQEVVVLQLRLSQIWLARASVELWQRPQYVLEHVQQQAEERSLIVAKLDAVLDAPLQSLRAVGASFRRVGTQKAAPHHKQDLILVVDVCIWQLFGQQLIENDAEGVHVRLE